LFETPDGAARVLRSGNRRPGGPAKRAGAILPVFFSRAFERNPHGSAQKGGGKIPHAGPAGILFRSA
jgi:hypothetical protein